MFALEIDFHDGVSTPETLLVRRPHALVGTSDFAHVVIEGAASSLCELRITRKQGQRFLCEAIRKTGDDSAQVPFEEGIYEGEAELHLGEVTTTITPLDVDLGIRADESPDRAGVRVLREALSLPITSFPAVAVAGSVPIIISFPYQKPLVVGRSRKRLNRRYADVLILMSQQLQKFFAWYNFPNTVQSHDDQGVISGLNNQV